MVMMAISCLLFFLVSNRAMRNCIGKSCQWKIICRQGIVQGSAMFRLCFCFWQGSMFRPAEEAALVLQDRLSATMEMLLSSILLLLLPLLICGGFGDKKGVLKVNRAEEKCRTKFSLELSVGTKYGHIWYFFMELSMELK
jgi:hypothetical protein